jgi:sugar-specific transcriptional regulator TrmB
MKDTLNFVNENSEIIQKYFLRLGFEPELTAIYIALFNHGAQTVSELSRNSGIERTRIYRLADELTASGLVEVETRYRRSIYKAAPISNLQILLAKKEQELSELQDGLAEINDLFTNASQHSGTRVQFYNGKEGAKQLFWNETKAKSEMLCILSENMPSKTNNIFFERWVRRVNERGIRCRGLIGSAFLESQKQWYSGHQNERIDHWESRFVSDDLFKIRHSTIIYDNVTSYYSWQSKEVFGLEIYNQEIADTQRGFFEMLWQQAEPIDKSISQQRND